MTGEEYLIKIQLQLKDDKALKALTSQMEKAAKAAPKAGTAFKKAGKSAGQFGNKAQNVGYQLQDLVVQIQGGTDASRALSQQLPQMLVGFGAWGAAVGVVTALLPTLIALTGESSASAEDAADSWDEYTEAVKRWQETNKEVDAVVSTIKETRALEERNKVVADFIKQAKELADFGKTDGSGIAGGAGRGPKILSSFGTIEDFERYNQIISEMNSSNLEKTAADLGFLAAGMGALADQGTVKAIEDMAVAMTDFDVATGRDDSSKISYLDQLAIDANDYAQMLEEVKIAESELLQAQLAADAKREESAQRALDTANRKLAATLQPVQANKGNADLDARYKAFMREEEALRKLGESYTLALNPLKAYEAELATLAELYNRNYISAETAAKGVEQAAETYSKAQEDISSTNEVVDIFNDTFQTAVDGVASGTQSMSDAFENMAKSIIAQLLKIAAQKAIMSSFGFDLTASEKGNVFSGGNVIPFAKGGVVNSPAIFPMANGAAGLMGEAGPEAIMPLSRGTNGKLGVEAAPVNVVINNNAPGVSVQQRQTDEGLTLDVVMDQVSAAIAKGGNSVSNAMENTYSLGRGRAVY